MDSVRLVRLDGSLFFLQHVFLCSKSFRLVSQIAKKNDATNTSKTFCAF